MPRPRPRREPCDCVECRPGFTPDTVRGTAIARQQPPPKCLILYASNQVDVKDLQKFATDIKIPHIDSAVKEGCSGLLAFRTGMRHKNLHHLENLFCTIPVEKKVHGKGYEERGFIARTIPCTMVSSNNEAQVFALSAGFSRASSFEDFTGRHDISSNIIADSIAKYLGFEDLELLDAPVKRKPPDDTEDNELLFVDLGSLPEMKDGNSIQHLEMMDNILKELNQRSNFHDSVLLVLLFRIQDLNGAAFPEPGAAQTKGPGEYSMLSKPKQSFEFACMDEVQTIDKTQFIYSLQRLPYVVREDTVQAFPSNLENISLGDGCILAERLLPSLAYKLDRAPKYGA